MEERIAKHFSVVRSRGLNDRRNGYYIVALGIRHDGKKAPKVRKSGKSS